MTLHDLAVGDEVIIYDGSKERLGKVTRVTASQVEAYPLTLNGKIYSGERMHWKKTGRSVGEYFHSSITVSTPEKRREVLDSLERDDLRQLLSRVNWHRVDLASLRIAKSALEPKP